MKKVTRSFLRKEIHMISQMLPTSYGNEILSTIQTQGLILDQIITIYILIFISILYYSCKRSLL